MMVFVIVLTLVLTITPPAPTSLVFQHLLVYIQLDTTFLHSCILTTHR